MRVAITGGTGMIGTQLAAALRARGDEVIVVTRRAPRGPDEVQWDPVRGLSPSKAMEDLDAVVNLSGAPLADRPWTRARRKVILSSRIDATRVLLDSLAELRQPPRSFIGVGALGRYGDRGDDWVEDDDPPGSGWLADLAVAWEDQQLEATERIGARTAVLRMGLVLSPTGGALPLIVVPFRLGIGGWLGNGQQFTPWVSIRDCVGMFTFLLDHPECTGGFVGNVPEPVRNKDWCRALGRALHRPVAAHAPRWALRGALGELADHVFLASCRARPHRLLEAGYTFTDVDVDETFRWLVIRLEGER